MSRTIAALLVLAAALAACADGRNRIEGIVIDVVGVDITTVDEFTVRTSDGEVLTFTPSGTGDFPFPLSHLREHLASVSPIVVSFEEDADGRLVATAVDDVTTPHS